VSVIGYCMGGNLALLALATDPALPIRSVVTMATPVDFSQIPRLVLDVSERVTADSVIDESGLVPASVVDRLFRIRRPTSDVVQYANLWQNLWDDEFMEGYQAMGRWLREQVPIAGAAFRQLAEEWVRGNGFVKGTLRVGGRPADFASIRVPVLAVIATHDDIVPEGAAKAIVGLLPNAELEVARLEAGHASLTVGRVAAKVATPVVTDWLAARSKELG
jgi:polyhydroxyalkanoate synthase